MLKGTRASRDDVARSQTKNAKVGKVMHEFKERSLRSSSGQKVKSRKQAVAIALSEAGLSRDDK